MNNNDDFTEKIQKDYYYYYYDTTKYYYWFALAFIIYTVFWVWAIRVKLFKSSNSTQVK